MHSGTEIPASAESSALTRESARQLDRESALRSLLVH